MKGPQKSALALFFTLCFLFLVGVGVRYYARLSAQENVQDSLLFSERLVLIAEFHDLEPDQAEQLKEIARGLKDDESVRAVIDGKTPEEGAELTPLFRQLAEYRQSGDPELESVLRSEADLAERRFKLSGGLLLGIWGLALSCFFFGNKERKEPTLATDWPALGVLGLFLGWDAFNFFGVQILISSLHELLPQFWLLLVAQGLGYGFMLALLVAGCDRGFRKLFGRFPWAWVGRGYLLAVVSVIGTSLLVGALLGETPRSMNPLLGIFANGATWQIVVLAHLVVAVGPFFEEVLFRGWLLGGLRGRLGDRGALVLSAVLFSVIHGDPYATPALFVLGLVFGWVYLRSGSVLASTLVHGMWNATTFCFLFSGIP